MLANMKPMQVQIEEQLNMGQVNPFKVTLDVTTAQAITELAKKRSTDPKTRSDTSNNQTKNTSGKQDEGKVSLLVAGPPTPPSNDTTTKGNDHVDDNKTKTPEVEQPDPEIEQPDAKVGLA